MPELIKNVTHGTSSRYLCSERNNKTPDDATIMLTQVVYIQQWPSAQTLQCDLVHQAELAGLFGTTLSSLRCRAIPRQIYAFNAMQHLKKAISPPSHILMLALTH